MGSKLFRGVGPGSDDFFCELFTDLSSELRLILPVRQTQEPMTPNYGVLEEISSATQNVASAISSWRRRARLQLPQSCSPSCSSDSRSLTLYNSATIHYTSALLGPSRPSGAGGVVRPQTHPRQAGTPTPRAVVGASLKSSLSRKKQWTWRSRYPGLTAGDLVLCTFSSNPWPCETTGAIRREAWAETECKPQRRA